MKFEQLQYEDALLPIIFHPDMTLRRHSTHLHWHDAVEFVLVSEGQVTLMNDGRQYAARPGELICVHAGHMHYYEADGDGCRYDCLILPPELIDSPSLYQSALPFCTTDAQAVALCREVTALLRRRERFYRELVKAKLVELYAVLAQAGGTEYPNTNHTMNEIVKSAALYIARHYHEKLTVDAVASAVGVSACHLCHVFKNGTGKTLTDYWQGVRCDKARRLLREGASVSQAADLAGFASPRYFSKIYQKNFGILPSKDKK